MQIFQACRREVLTLKWTIIRKWLGSCIREGNCSKKREITNMAPPPHTFFPPNTCKYICSWLEFSGRPSTLGCLVIKPQHFTPLTCLTPVCGLRWMVRFLALRRSIRHCKHIFNYKALAPGRPWQSDIHAEAIFLRVLHLMPDGVSAHNAWKQCGWWFQNAPAAMI